MVFRLLSSIVVAASMGTSTEDLRAASAAATALQSLPGTSPLTMTGDIASALVEGADRFLLKKTEESIQRRAGFWHRDLSSPEKYNASIEPNRQRLAHILGVRDPRVPFDGLELVATTSRPALVGKGDGYDVFAVRWPAFGDVHGEGLLLAPTGRQPVADVVAIPDADQSPEMIAGLVGGVPAASQLARRLAESGCRVVVPVLIDRQMTGDKISRREFLYRSAYELGRHLIGYEVQKVLAVVDWFAKEAKGGPRKIGVLGWGEGGRVALYAAALDTRINTALASGYFDARENVWQEPADRNVFGLLEQFGDAELAAMVAPRALVIEAASGPEYVFPVGLKGAPGRLTTPKLESVRREVERAKGLMEGLAATASPLTPSPSPKRGEGSTKTKGEGSCELVVSGEGNGPFGSSAALESFLRRLSPGHHAERDEYIGKADRSSYAGPEGFDGMIRARMERQVHEIDRHNQELLAESPAVRAKFFSRLDTSSLEKYEKSIEWYRDYFYNEVVGRFDQKPLPFNPRTRLSYDKPKWTGYEVVLDVYPDVIAYGVLLVPKDVRPGEKRPVVVCQHGLEGRPQDVIEGDSRAYHGFAARLAEEGFITFAPQNLYLFKDRFRTLQRKANPIKKTLFSVIVPQHQQMLDWLKTLPFVDGRRIAFYGLSYGGKTAMRVPPLVKDYCLSICSGDFNEWVAKNASHAPYSYANKGEYEIFEFDLGSTFNYAEMAALICPRPFMVERGHFDGVGVDEMIAYEYAKVRYLYEAKLGIGDRTELEWFVGPHTIHGVGTFDFLRKHLKSGQQSAVSSQQSAVSDPLSAVSSAVAAKRRQSIARGR